MIEQGIILNALSVRQRMYVRKIIEYRGQRSKKEIAIESGYSPATAHNATQNIEKRCSGAIRAALAADGIDEERIAEVLKSALNAEKSVLQGWANTKTISRNGGKKEIRRLRRNWYGKVPDHRTRLKAVELIGRFLGYF